ncbi:peptidoglycan-binding protein LysM [Lutibacter sp.]|uniref:peptidoglycan-binding protein LysM n=1 Tax=Lutibacter sp. TaxID=1925666 RepID=UPI0025C21B46|nr:peptidoglycan-binding protein LysM [Lutibacter sp.]MCF6180985.1 peptidoglycan-binding protein LysM [Lutibacter sp.]
MKKIVIIFSLLALVIIVSSFSNKSKVKNTVIVNKYYSTVQTKEQSNLKPINIPFVGKSFTGFKEAVAFKESQGNYNTINTLGYLGKYQFGRTTLERFNIYNTRHFLKDPELQEDAFIALCSVNKWILRKDIRRSTGKTINHIKITESGILAAAHLAGAGNVKKYLRSNGNLDFKDAYGSTVQHYLKQFSGYDTSIIEASKNPVL